MIDIFVSSLVTAHEARAVVHIQEVRRNILPQVGMGRGTFQVLCVRFSEYRKTFKHRTVTYLKVYMFDICWKQISRLCCNKYRAPDARRNQQPVRWTRKALWASQYITEQIISDLLSEANRAAKHAKRVTVGYYDLDFIKTVILNFNRTIFRIFIFDQIFNFSSTISKGLFDCTRLVFSFK